MEEFVRSRQDVVEMNRMRVQLGEDDIGELDGLFTVERVMIRMGALDALREYGQLLKLLTTSSQKGELKSASDSFVANLGNVRGGSLSIQDGDAISAAIQSIGGLYVERKRKRALVEVVETAHPHVVSLVDLVEASYHEEGENWSLEYEAVADDLEAAALTARAWDEDADLSSSALIELALETAKTRKQRFEIIAAAITDACRNLRKAEGSLRQILARDSLSLDDVDHYVRQVEELGRVYRVLSQ
jgi:hypothetical protein